MYHDASAVYISTVQSPLHVHVSVMTMQHQCQLANIHVALYNHSTNPEANPESDMAVTAVQERSVAVNAGLPMLKCQDAQAQQQGH